MAEEKRFFRMKGVSESTTVTCSDLGILQNSLQVMVLQRVCLKIHEC
ncbi:hypothetical protein SAMN04488128_106156 [Chitinophaga eiseniae]|uniref:Uncharacterized protein n=1 Tax=Chitinophaga eiseniae TaxID=634771 RepID=A0A1T4TS34_9BACT|nr:hypothetical protein SAMN04488128_106156 [Chitinophaga eiseniae]